MVELEAGVGGEVDADVSPRLRFLGSLAWFLPTGADSLFCGSPGFIIKGLQHSGTTWVVSERVRAGRACCMKSERPGLGMWRAEEDTVVCGLRWAGGLTALIKESFDCRLCRVEEAGLFRVCLFSWAGLRLQECVFLSVLDTHKLARISFL